VPDQTGRTNYVDNDRLGFGAGVNYECPLWIPGSLRVSGCKVKCTCCASVLNGSSINERAVRGRHYPQLVQDEWADGATNNPRRSAPESNGLQTKQSRLARLQLQRHHLGRWYKPGCDV